jgi:rubrerythrin
MSVLDRLTNALASRTESYVCRFCRLTFERERRNCPACGCDEITPGT